MARRTNAPLASLLAAFRADEADPAFLESVEAAVAADVAVWIRLGPLTPEDVDRLIEETGVPSAAGQAARVHAYAGGNPMFVLEVLEGMWLNVPASDGDEARGLAPTDRLRVVVGRRLNRLSAEARSVLDALAITAPDTSMDLLTAVAKQPVRQVASGLAALEAERLQGRPRAPTSAAGPRRADRASGRRGDAVQLGPRSTTPPPVHLGP